MTQKKWFIPLVFTAILLFMLAMAFAFGGTGESGDSITHYMFARYAFAHNNLFFDVWGKPVFTLLASPFAQFGFTGIKVFNVLVTVLAMLCTYLTAKKIGLDNSWVAIVLLLIAPMNFTLAFSGLTEPLFATFIICGLCLLYYEKTTAALILFSFLPFVRSEGMFLLIIIALWLIVQRKYLTWLWLTFGQIVGAVIGYFHFKTFLWYYKTNPYSLVSAYGHGRWTDYPGDLPVVINPVTTLLLGIGCLLIPLLALLKIKRLFSETKTMQLLLVWMLFVAYFLFHTIAWTFGLFASFGMVRILIGVAPLMILIALYTFNTIVNLIGRQNATRTSVILVVSFVIINVYYIDFNKSKFTETPGFEIQLSPDQEIENNLAKYMKSKYPDYRNHAVCYMAPYVGVALDVDPFDPAKHIETLDYSGHVPEGGCIVWDSWFSLEDGKIPLDSLKKDNTLIKDTTMTCVLGNNSPYSIVLFRRK